MREQVAIVTGGAGGIGSAVCRRLASAGGTVVITYHHDGEKAQKVVDSLEGAGHLISRTPVDDSNACARLAALLEKRFSKVDLLVNNAGITTAVPHSNLEALTDEWIDRIFQVNWRGAFASVRSLQPLLERGKGGTIINLSSSCALTGHGSNVAYCASKAALDSMTRSLARALAPKIRVVSVAPGWVLGDYAKKMPLGYIEAQRVATPLQKLATPEDVAETIWAVHTQMPMLTGSAIAVDGGRPLGF